MSILIENLIRKILLEDVSEVDGTTELSVTAGNTPVSKSGYDVKLLGTKTFGKGKLRTQHAQKIAKNNGARLVTTPYILFIDADVRFFKNTVIQDAVDKIQSKNLDLVGLNIKCYDRDMRAIVGFTLFNTINHTLKFFSPFAVGAFMLTRKDRFDEFGGFPEQFATSEDYFLSRKYNPRKFRIVRHHFGQDSRRFKKMGYLGMGKYLIKNFINRNNKKYWDSLDSSKYWS